jgi:hypothetical protein
MTDNELTSIRRAAYEAACLAESFWQDELDRVYGKASIEARYDRKRNAATPMLKALRDVKDSTAEAWLTLGKIVRNEIAA